MNARLIHRQNRAIVGVEMIVSIVILMVIAVMAAQAIFYYTGVQDQYAWRQAAALAADAQLQRYQAGASLDSMPPDGMLAERIKLTTDTAAGVEQWRGFQRVTVTANVNLPSGKRISEQISGYVRAEVQP